MPKAKPKAVDRDAILAELGYRPALETLTPRKRLLVSSEGEQKTGKTHFMLTAPKPMIVYNFDTGLDELLEKTPFNSQLGEIIPVNDFRFDMRLQPGSDFKVTDRIHNECVRKWEEFREHMARIAATNAVRSVGIDSGSHLYYLASLARWGKFGQVPQQAYGALYIEFEETLKVFYDSDINLIVTHKLKDKFDGPGMEMRGYKDMPFLLQAHIQHRKAKKTGELSIEVRECRHNRAAEGQILEINEPTEEEREILGDAAVSTGGGFLDLVKVILPDEDLSDWA